MKLTLNGIKESPKIRISTLEPGILVTWEDYIYLTARIEGTILGVNLAKGTYLGGHILVNLAPLGTKVTLEVEEKDGE